MAFELPDLPYAHDALAAGGMSQETLEFHHDLHHKAYVDNGNKLLAGSGHEDKSLEEIIKATYNSDALVQSGLFNNASQHWNHIQFWEMMAPAAATCLLSWKAQLLTASVPSTSSRKNLRRRCRPVRFGLVLAGQGYRWRAQGNKDRKWR